MTAPPGLPVGGTTYRVLRGLVTAMFAFALATAVEGAQKHRELPMPPWVYGALALTMFFLLFLFTWAFRSVGTRH